MKMFKFVERWKEQKRLREEEKAEIERLEREQKKEELIRSLREKIDRVSRVIENEREKARICHERTKELVRKYGKKAQITRKRAALCLTRRKMTERFEMIVEVWDQATEKIELLSEMAGALELLSESVKIFDKAFAAYKVGDISLLGIRLKRMDSIIEKITATLDIQLRTPSVEVSSKEVDRFLDELEAEVKAEEEARLKEIETEKRIKELSEKSNAI